jgi:hypothetical protein
MPNYTKRTLAGFRKEKADPQLSVEPLTDRTFLKLLPNWILIIIRNETAIRFPVYAGLISCTLPQRPI